MTSPGDLRQGPLVSWVYGFTIIHYLRCPWAWHNPLLAPGSHTFIGARTATVGGYRAARWLFVSINYFRINKGRVVPEWRVRAQ